MEQEKSSIPQVNKETHSQLILTLDRANCLVTLAGYTLNYNEAINILSMAIREFEAKIADARVLDKVERVAAPGVWPNFGRKH